MIDKIRIVQFGCGPIGCSMVRTALTKQVFELKGAIDLTNIGVDIGELADVELLNVYISNDAETTLIESKPQLVFHATGSSLKEIYPQIELIIKAGANVISTCEELTFPFREQPELALKIDQLAKENSVTVLGTGVNPGFLMDTWPLVMSAVCENVNHITVSRVQDASKRRIPFQKKIGAGTTVEEFNNLVNQRKIRHVGLSESIAMLAAGLKWQLDNINCTIEPIIAEKEVRSDYIKIQPGYVAGVKQNGYGWFKNRELIKLEFAASIGAEKSYDRVYIEGTQNLETIIKGGTPGDFATSAMAVNSAKRVLDAPPGLKTMIDIPLVCSWSSNNSI